MNKIKIGLLGASAISVGSEIVKSFPYSELSCIYDSNSDMLDISIKYAKENGFYIKKFNNADDFYSSKPHAVLATRSMYDYIRNDCKTLLLDGSCDFENVFDGLYMKHNEALYFYDKEWKNACVSKLSPSGRLSILKNPQNVALLFFKLNF